MRSWSVRRSRAVIAGGAFLVVAFAAVEAAASEGEPEGSPERLVPSVSMHLSYGLVQSEQAPNRFGLGMGLRVGAHVASPAYVGASLEHFYGTRDGDPLDPSFREGTRTDQRLSQVLLWVGYSLSFDDVTFRPMLGLGLGRTTRVTVLRRGSPGATFATTTTRDERDDLAFAPMLELEFPVGPLGLLASVRYNVLPGGDPNDDDSALVIGVGLSVSL